MFIRPGGGGAGWVDRTCPFRRGCPRNGARTRSRTLAGVRWAGDRRGRRRRGGFALPRRSRHEKRGGQPGTPCVCFFQFFPTAFLLCRPARPTRWWAWPGGGLVQGLQIRPVRSNRQGPVPVYRTDLTENRFKPVEFKFKFKSRSAIGSDRFTGRFGRFIIELMIFSDG